MAKPKTLEPVSRRAKVEFLERDKCSFDTTGRLHIACITILTSDCL
jgi:hypothetical protein